jgi:hypothetical protein
MFQPCIAVSALCWSYVVIMSGKGLLLLVVSCRQSQLEGLRLAAAQPRLHPLVPHHRYWSSSKQTMEQQQQQQQGIDPPTTAAAAAAAQPVGAALGTFASPSAASQLVLCLHACAFRG